MNNHALSFYQQFLHFPKACFSPIEHDDAMVALVYKITQVNGPPLILKICSRTGDYLREIYFLNYFAGHLPVPRLVQAIPGEENRGGAVLMECVPGSLLQLTDFTDKLAYEAGVMLASIHLNRTTGYGDLIEPQTLTTDPCYYFTFKFEEGFAECSQHLSQELLRQCRHYYNAHLDLLSSVDGPCIVHRDFRPGNLMIDQGNIQGIIDWSSARASFAEEDFCSMEHGEWPTVSKASFLSGYASIRPIPDYKKLMPLLRLSKAIAAIGFTVKRGTWETANACLYQHNRCFLEHFLKK